VIGVTTGGSVPGTVVMVAGALGFVPVVTVVPTNEVVVAVYAAVQVALKVPGSAGVAHATEPLIVEQADPLEHVSSAELTAPPVTVIATELTVYVVVPIIPVSDCPWARQATWTVDPAEMSPGAAEMDAVTTTPATAA
jgi:hypothetical protein